MDGITIVVNMDNMMCAIYGCTPQELALVYLPSTLQEFADAANPTVAMMKRGKTTSMPLARMLTGDYNPKISKWTDLEAAAVVVCIAFEIALERMPRGVQSGALFHRAFKPVQYHRPGIRTFTDKWHSRR